MIRPDLPRDLTCDEVEDLVAGLALGALEADEAFAVAAHLSTCERHPQASDLLGAAAALALVAEPVEPPAALRDRILVAAGTEVDARSAPGAVRPLVIPMARFRAPAWRLGARIAAIAAAVALLAWNVGLQSRLGTLEDAVADARAHEQAVSEVLSLAALPDGRLVLLSPTEATGPRGLAALQSDGSIVLAMRGLTPTIGTEVYEAWVIVGDAAPVPIGGFSVGAAGTASLSAPGTPATGEAVVALTREPGPGATTPTLPILALGTASGPTS